MAGKGRSIMNVEFLESFEVSRSPEQTNNPQGSAPPHYILRLKIQGNPVVLELELTHDQITELVFELSRHFDHQTYS